MSWASPSPPTSLSGLALVVGGLFILPAIIEISLLKPDDNTPVAKTFGGKK